MEKIKILIADDVAQTRAVIRKMLTIEKQTFEIVGEAANGEEVLELIPKVHPQVVLMDINMPLLNGLEATEKIADKYPQVIVIIMSVQAENEYLKRAMFAGAKEYIIKPLEFEKVVYTITNTYEKQKQRQTINKSYIEEKNAKIFTFFSSKGGVGKSILAVNSAVVFSEKFRKKTLLMDMDLLFGDLSMLMNQPTHKTIADIMDEGTYDTYESMKPYLYSFDENLDVLFAPKKPEASEYIGKDMIEKMMGFLKKQYDMILIDTAVNFSDLTLYLLDLSDQILFTTTMEISSLKNTKLGMGVMESLHYDHSKVKLIVNEVNTQYGITKKDVEDTFENSIFAMVPEDIKNIRYSINQGNPLCHSPKMKKTKVVKSIQKMCEELSM